MDLTDITSIRNVRIDSLSRLHRTVRCLSLLVIGVFAGLVLLPSGAAFGQTKFSLPGASADDLASELFPDLSLGGFGKTSDSPGEWSGAFSPGVKPGTGRLEVSVKLGGGWHVYSLTQKKGAALPTEISVLSPESVRTTGPWQSTEEPTISATGTGGAILEEHGDFVVFFVPVALPADFSGAITVQVSALACRTGKCVPIDEKLTVVVDGAKSGGAVQTTVAVTQAPVGDSSLAKVNLGQSFRDGNYVVKWDAGLAKEPVGGVAALEFTAAPDHEFHVYVAATDMQQSSTIFVATQKEGLKVGAPRTTSKVITLPSPVPGIPEVSYHKGAVSWQLPIALADDTKSGDKTLEGYIAYQACTDRSCHRPVALSWKAKVKVDTESGSVKLLQPIQLVTAKWKDATGAASANQWVDKVADDSGSANEGGEPVAGGNEASSPESGAPVAVGDSDKSSTSFITVLGLALVAGLILNVMPCVLPVVGLKVMGFVAQAGEDRRRILMLNVVYSLGILFVFAILGGLAAGFSLSWGEQFTYVPFRLGLTFLIFALALSYLGVWEIPVPGMASSKTSQDLQAREGYLGAFSKGAFATVLATPCSGPLLGLILGLTLNLSGAETMIVIMTVGVGMAFPYLLLGLNPKWISFLPKPGGWMDTFKQFLAFLLLGTVAFFFAGFKDEHRVPLFISLIGIWFGCWMIGLVPNWETMQKRVVSWIGGVTAAALISVGAFHYLEPVPDDLQWIPYNEARLQQLTAEGNTVMLDFTASWCVNCKWNTATAIDTELTAEMVHTLGAIPMLADWSDRSDPAIKAKVQELESNSIPLLAIYPGRRPDSPIILRDLVSQAAVLDALQQAGPSLGYQASSTTKVALATH